MAKASRSRPAGSARPARTPNAARSGGPARDPLLCGETRIRATTWPHTRAERSVSRRRQASPGPAAARNRGTLGRHGGAIPVRPGRFRPPAEGGAGLAPAGVSPGPGPAVWAWSRSCRRKPLASSGRCGRSRSGRWTRPGNQLSSPRASMIPTAYVNPTCTACSTCGRPVKAPGPTGRSRNTSPWPGNQARRARSPGRRGR